MIGMTIEKSLKGANIMKLPSALIFYRSALFLIIALAILSGCANTLSVSPTQSAAYKAAMSGDVEKARNILEKNADNSLSTFMLACFELSEGNLPQARRYADEFIANEPYIADGKVLRELIDQRKAYPSEPWTVSYASAWKASGSPQMTVGIYGFIEESREPSAKCEPREIPEAIKGTPEEMLVAFDYGFGCDPKKFMELCLSHTAPKTPLSIKLLALGCIDLYYSDETTEFSEDLRKRVLSGKHDLLEELSAKQPQYMAFPIVAILDQTRDTEEFSPLAIDRLEEAVSRPLIAPSRIELYDDYLTRFLALNEENPYLNAYSQVIMAEGTGSWGLRRKILKTAEKGTPEVKKRLARVLEKLGKAQVRRGTVIELLLSFSTLYSAEELRGDKSAQEQLRPIHVFASSLVQIQNDASPSFFWPIRPLMINSLELAAKNEIAFYQLFADADMPDELLQLLKD